MKYDELEKDLVEFISQCDKRDLPKTQDIINSKYFVYNVKIPQLKNFSSDYFNSLDSHNQIEVCFNLINKTNISEVVTWALYKLDSFSYSLLLEYKKELLLLSYKIENWWHADHLSSIYARLFDKHKLLLKEFQLWAKQGNLWQRRLSLTSLLYYSKQRKNPATAKTLLSQVEMLLDDEEYYVQKGVGWTLREIYNLYPEDTFEFIRVYAKEISTVAFSPATEKLSKEKKEELKLLRKKGVSNPYYFEHN